MSTMECISKLTGFTVVPAHADRWSDLEALFGERGAYAGCWCMFWRMERTVFKAQKGAGTKAALQALCQETEPPGLLLYHHDVIAGWCALGPRERFLALKHSRILKRIDDQAVWSIPCFFVAKPFRRKGAMRHLLSAALVYAQQHGVHIVEGYPLQLDATLTSFGGYMGIASTFREIGFVEVGRASATQLIMRYSFA